MRKVSMWLAGLLIRAGVAADEDREVYEYGIDIALYTLLSTLGLLAIGLAFGRFFEGALMIAVFYLCQSYGGGYHAHSHLTCFVTMAAGLAAALGLLLVPIPLAAHLVLAALSLLLLVRFPLVLHENKSYLEADRGRLTRRSYIVSISLGCAAALCALLLPALAPAACLALVFAAISRFSAWVGRKRAARASWASQAE